MILYFSCIALLAFVGLMFEYDVLPRGVVADDPTTTYALNLLSIVATIGGTFVLLYWWRIPAIIRRSAAHTGDAAAAFTRRMHSCRILLWTILTLGAILIYYLAPYAHNALHSILILLIAGIFCWPGTSDHKKE